MANLIPKDNGLKTDPCWKTNKDCELASVAASQFSTFILVLAATLIIAYKMWIFASHDKGDLGTKILSAQYSIVLIIVTLCYILGVWKIEREDIEKTRQLTGFYSHLEWIIRVIILVFIGLASIVSAGLIPWFGQPITAGLFFLTICCLLFLLWDNVVIGGGQIERAWNYFFLDLFGCFAAILSFASYESNSDDFKIFGLIVSVVFAVWSILFFWDEMKRMCLSVIQKKRRR